MLHVQGFSDTLTSKFYIYLHANFKIRIKKKRLIKIQKVVENYT